MYIIDDILELLKKEGMLWKIWWVTKDIMVQFIMFDNMAVYKGIYGYRRYVPYEMITTLWTNGRGSGVYRNRDTQDKKAGRDALSEKIAWAYQR